MIESGKEEDRFKIYGEEIKKREDFAYLGVVINRKGIDWNKHWKRLKKKSNKTMGLIRDFGCNSNGFNIRTCGKLYKMFIQPIMEYGIALCHKKKDIEIPMKRYKEGMKTIFGVRTGVKAEVLGIWTNVNSPMMRQKKLGFRFYKRIERMSKEKYAVRKAYEKGERKGGRKSESCFYQFEKNEMILKYRKGRLVKGEKRKEREIWEEEERKRNEEVVKKYKGGYIFKGKNQKEIEEFIKEVSKTEKKIEREIILWTLNKSAGKWKTCKKCGKEGIKEHMERCIYGEESIEEELRKAKKKEEIERIGKKIQEIRKRIG